MRWDHPQAVGFSHLDGVAADCAGRSRDYDGLAWREVEHIQRHAGSEAVHWQRSRFGAVEDHILGLLDVQVARAQMPEHMRQHARTIPMPYHQHVRRRGVA